jgi:hypothetical protein
VPEKLLNLAQVRPHIEQMSRITVTQAMGMDVFPQIRTDTALTENSARFSGCETPWFLLPARPQGDKKWLAHQSWGATHIDPSRQRSPRLLGNRNHPFFRTLSEYANFLGPQLEVSHIESHQLSDSNACAVKQLDERSISHHHPLRTPRPISPIRRRLRRHPMILRDELFAVIDRQGSRESLFEFRHRQPSRRII